MVEQFGGTRKFTPPLVIADNCKTNCSFVSGEVSAIVTPFLVGAMIFPQARLALLATSAVTGLITGAIRMSQGGHFLSDVLFAIVVMALTASLMHVLLVGLWQSGRRLTTRFAPVGLNGATASSSV